MSQKKRTKVEEKIRTAKACINGEISIRGAASQLGIDHHAVEDWIRLRSICIVEPWRKTIPMSVACY